jgi:hypothetical protein
VPGGFGELRQFSVDSKGNVYAADDVLGRPQKLPQKRVRTQRRSSASQFR